MALTETDLAARAALKVRQGKGARYDAPEAPAHDLLLARRGSAFFARKLNELGDAALFAPSAVEGWTRAHVVARISYEARLQAFALEALMKGETAPAASEDAHRLPPLDLAATLPARALRHLFSHSQVHLNVCWRDLAAQHWDGGIVLADGTRAAVRSLPLARARSVWHGALELGNGARRNDLPEEIRT